MGWGGGGKCMFWVFGVGWMGFRGEGGGEIFVVLKT